MLNPNRYMQLLTWTQHAAEIHADNIRAGWWNERRICCGGVIICCAFYTKTKNPP